jgi:hypothetical protein
VVFIAEREISSQALFMKMFKVIREKKDIPCYAIAFMNSKEYPK